MRQGTRANYTGANLESVIETVLQKNGYHFIERRQFDDARKNAEPIYSTQYPLCKSIYGTDISCDFILYHPEKHPDCLVIESKWQQSGGSVDEKFPYMVHNIREKYPCSTIILLAGGGYKKGAEEWLRAQEDDKLFHVFNMEEFMRWANSNEL